MFYHDNSLGSVVALTTGAGTVVESYRYEAFGKVSVFDQSGQAVSTTQVQQPFMFTGRRLDWEEGSGLYYYRLRYYDAAAGRFISRDPLGMWGDAAQNGNGQSYCGNNPVNRVDPWGLDEDDPQEGGLLGWLSWLGRWRCRPELPPLPPPPPPAPPPPPPVLVLNQLSGETYFLRNFLRSFEAKNKSVLVYKEDVPSTAAGFGTAIDGTKAVLILAHGNPQDGILAEDDERLNAADVDATTCTSPPDVVVVGGCNQYAPNGAPCVAASLYKLGVKHVFASHSVMDLSVVAAYIRAFVQSYAATNDVTKAHAAGTAAGQAVLDAHPEFENRAMPEPVPPPAQAGE